MNDSNILQWLIGVIIGIVAMIGGFITRDRQVMNAIKDGNDELNMRIKNGDDALHARISKIKDNYVRRSDLDGHIKRLEENVKELRNDIRAQSQETNKRLDAIIASFAKNKQ